jgi:hypothetical protein
MDPVSAGSAVLAFVVLALRSAQAVHTVLSEIKDGPHTLRHLVGEISQLRGILERLASLPPGYINEGDANIKVLESAAMRCAEDVARIESKLQRLNIRSTDRRVGKLWKLLLTAISEKELVQMQTFIRDHFIMLSVQMGLLQTIRLSASQSQLSEMNESLRRLTEQVSALRHNPSSVAAVARPVKPALPALEPDLTSGTLGVRDSPAVPAIDLELEQSLARLVEFVGGKESTVESDDAQQMIDDLEALLRAAEREESKADYEPHDQRSQEENLSGELKLIRRLIGAAPTLSVNGTGMTIANPPLARSELI